ncbi:hypothetical protein TELCIR_16253 [Teladorsagia circumcincta]|uniref:Uncharacterized protein n=1 Tax=Teladorsagia circumcincta TaxID=45464 RepID=A0A2G9TY84_TELCI|nr:hypothetical protein TELCIR_16253 [Teladorsagia circumcincta]
MPRHLLAIASKLFLCEDHILLHPFYYVLERLSYQSMQPSQLRNFLRLDLPLCCRNLDETNGDEPTRANEGGPVPLQRRMRDEEALDPVYLLRVLSYNNNNKKGPCHLACLTIQFSPIDRSLLISTDEHENPGGDLEKEAKIPSEKLGISSSDNSTPLRIMTNTVAHAPGAGRAFGAVIIGYLGMRTFIPRPVPRLLDSMGGYACLYGLVAMATDSEGLYASLKAVVSATLAVLLEDKANLMNSHIMHMIFSMAGTLDTAREIATIPNAQAFEDLLCDLDIWEKAPEEQHRMLYEHFYELITEKQRTHWNEEECANQRLRYQERFLAEQCAALTKLNGVPRTIKLVRRATELANMIVVRSCDLS